MIHPEFKTFLLGNIPQLSTKFCLQINLMPFLVAWKNMFSLEITRTYEYNITYQVIQSVTFFYPRYLQVTWTHHPPKEVTCSWSLVPGRRGPGSWKQRGPPAGQHQRCFCSRNVPFGDGFKLVGVGGVCCFLCVVTFSWVCVCVCVNFTNLLKRSEQHGEDEECWR